MGLAGIALGVTGSFVWLAIVSTLARLVVYALSIAALPKAEQAGRRHLGDDRRGARRLPLGRGAVAMDVLGDARRPGRRRASCSTRWRAVRPAPAPPPRFRRSSRRRAPARRHRSPPPGRARRHIRARRKVTRSPSNDAGAGRASERTLTVRPSRWPSPSQLTPSSRAARTASAAFGPTTTRAVSGSSREHVERLGLAADLQPAPLADGEMDQAAMRAQHPPVAIDDLARPRRLGPHLLDDPRIIAVGDEADVLAVRLVGDEQAELAGEIAHRRASAGRRAGSAGNRAGRGSSRTGNSSGRGPDRRRGAAPARSRRRRGGHNGRSRGNRRRARGRSRAGRRTSRSGCRRCRGSACGRAHIRRRSARSRSRGSGSHSRRHDGRCRAGRRPRGHRGCRARRSSSSPGRPRRPDRRAGA